MATDSLFTQKYQHNWSHEMLLVTRRKVSRLTIIPCIYIMRRKQQDTKAKERDRCIDSARTNGLKHRWNVWVILGRTRSRELASPVVRAVLSITVTHCGAAEGVGGIHSVPRASWLESVASIFCSLAASYPPPQTFRIRRRRWQQSGNLN